MEESRGKLLDASKWISRKIDTFINESIWKLLRIQLKTVEVSDRSMLVLRVPMNVDSYQLMSVCAQLETELHKFYGDKPPFPVLICNEDMDFEALDEKWMADYGWFHVDNPDNLAQVRESLKKIQQRAS